MPHAIELELGSPLMFEERRRSRCVCCRQMVVAGGGVCCPGVDGADGAPGETFGVGDRLLVLVLGLVSAVLLVLALVPGWDSGALSQWCVGSDSAEVCTVVENCTYTDGYAVGQPAEPLAATHVGDERKTCCDACRAHAECVVATFLDANATAMVPMGNCFFYSATSVEKVKLEGASLCSLPTDGSGSAVSAAARSSLEQMLQTLLGASAVLTRFGGLVVTLLLPSLLEAVGYGGAGLVSSVLTPRKAAAAARAAAGEAATDWQTAGVPAAAGWEAIAANMSEADVAKPQLVVGGEHVELKFGFGPHEDDLDIATEVVLLSSAGELRGKLALIYRGDHREESYVQLSARAEQAAAAGALVLIVVIENVGRNCCYDWTQKERRSDAKARDRATIPVFWAEEVAGATLAAAIQPVQLTMPAFSLRPSTWTEARAALGLSVRQAVWSCGSKLLLWHWSQPLSYLAVFGAYYCSSTSGTTVDDYYSQLQRTLGTWVVYREAGYLVCTLLALWLNPAFLLLELDSVLKPAEEEARGRCCLWWRRLDGAALKLWVVYLLAPHHYVTACLMRGARGAVRGDHVRLRVTLLLFMVGGLQMAADLWSAFALANLLLQPSPPAALAIGYWLTTAGLVAGAGGAGLKLLSVTRSGVNPFASDAGPLPCVLRVAFGLYAPFWGGMFAVGVGMLVLAPLQLSGVVHGLACPGGWTWACNSVFAK